MDTIVYTFRIGEEVFISEQVVLSTEFHALLGRSSYLISHSVCFCFKGTTFVEFVSNLADFFGCFNFSLRGKGARGTGT
jgi:hypothetical protein